MSDDFPDLPELPDDAPFSLHEQGQNTANDVFMSLSAQGLPIKRAWLDHDGTVLELEFTEEADGLNMNVQLESAFYGLTTMGGYRMWLSHLTMQIAARFQEIAPYIQQRRKLHMEQDAAIASIMRTARKR